MSLVHFIEIVNERTDEVALAPVTNLYDKYANETSDPFLAISCVVQMPNGAFVATSLDGLVIGAKH